MPKAIDPKTLTVSGHGIEAALRRSLRQRMLANEATAKSLRRLQLFDDEVSGINATKLSELVKPKGRWKAVDPMLQIMLQARDEFLDCEDARTRLGYFKCMQEIYSQTLKRNGDELLNLVSLAQRHRHHEDEMKVKANAKGGEEPSDDELAEMIASGQLKEAAPVVAERQAEGA